MKLALLFLIGALTAIQMPIVSNYSDFILEINKGNHTALRMESDEIKYGTLIHSQIYQEVLPVDEHNVLLVKEVFETMPTARNYYEPKGESFVCLCDKKDLVSILKRWKDGQHSIKDYAKFDCKYRSFTDPSFIFHGDSFWEQANLLAHNNKPTTITLAEKINVKIFKNRNNSSKKIIKIAFQPPVANIVKTIPDESYLLSVLSDKNKGLYLTNPKQGWKSLFPEWKDYTQLNTGFWGTPQRQPALRNGKYTQSFTIASDNTSSYTLKGQTTFWTKTNQQKKKSLKNILLAQNGFFIKGESYLDFGSFLKHKISSLDNNNKVTVAFDIDIPITSITIYDAHSGTKLNQMTQPPFESQIPSNTTNINLDITYSVLKKVRVEYATEK